MWFQKFFIHWRCLQAFDLTFGKDVHSFGVVCEVFLDAMSVLWNGEKVYPKIATMTIACTISFYGQSLNDRDFQQCWSTTRADTPDRSHNPRTYDVQQFWLQLLPKPEIFRNLRAFLIGQSYNFMMISLAQIFENLLTHWVRLWVPIHGPVVSTVVSGATSPA